jgi:hypothetical protein
MRVLSTKIHGIMDYLMVVLLAVSPWIFGFTEHPAAKFASPTFAAGVLVLALCTKFELGLIKIVSMKFHLIFDVFLGLALVITPWALAFAKYVYIPYVVMGLVQMFVAVVTKKVPAYLKNEKGVDPRIAEKNII